MEVLKSKIIITGWNSGLLQKQLSSGFRDKELTDTKKASFQIVPVEMETKVFSSRVLFYLYMYIYGETLISHA